MLQMNARAAAARLYPSTGWWLNPMIVGLAVRLSSISVVTKALRLRLSLSLE